MPRFLRLPAFWLALLTALPLQAYASYAKAGCSMAMTSGETRGGMHGEMHGQAHEMNPKTHGDCGDCEGADECGLMAFCHALQHGVSAHLPRLLSPQRIEHSVDRFVSAFPSRDQAPPVPPPRHV